MIPTYSLADVLKLPQQRPPLPEPRGPVVRVDSALEIIAAIEEAEDGSTIIIAKGHYRMPRDCILTKHRVVIRGETGNREDVILDAGMEFNDGTPIFGTRNGAPALIKIAHARGVTIADLTVANCPKYGILFFGDAGVHDLKIWNVKFHNNWARGLKGTAARSYDDRGYPPEVLPVSAEALARIRPRNGEVRGCLFICDHIKRNDKDFDNGDYIAGMDLMNVKDWVIAGNVFAGICGKNGGGRGAVFIWNEAEGVTVEDNVFFDCDRCVALGNPSGKADKPFHIRGATVRNNLLLGGTGKGIEIDYGDDITISGNRIASAVRTEHAAIQVLDITAKALVTGNEIARGSGPTYNLDAKVRVVDDRIG